MREILLETWYGLQILNFIITPFKIIDMRHCHTSQSGIPKKINKKCGLYSKQIILYGDARFNLTSSRIYIYLVNSSKKLVNTISLLEIEF